MLIKGFRIRFKYEKPLKVFLFFLVSVSIPGIFLLLKLDIARIDYINTLAIVAGFLASALAIIITNTNFSKESEKRILNNKEYLNHLKIYKTPKNIYKIQKEFLIWSILLEVSVIIITIGFYSIGSGVVNNTSDFIKCIQPGINYISLSLFVFSCFFTINITYYAIKHLFDFDIKY